MLWNIKEFRRDAGSTCTVGKEFTEESDALFLVTFHSSVILMG